VSIELRHLQTFVVVAEELHFTRAAERLHMAQPPLSNTIKQLEQELGARLFERTTRRVRLTGAGEVYLVHARNALAELDRGRESVLMALGGERGRIGVGLTGITTGRLLSRLARSYRARYPHVQLDLHPEAFSGPQEDALLDNRIDVGFLRHNVSSGLLASRPLFEEQLVATLPEQHHLAGREVVSIADLAGEDFVSYPPGQGSQLRQVFLAACSEAGFRPRVRQEAHDTHMVVALVSAEVGVALMPASVERFEVEGVVFRPLAERRHTLPVVLAWRAGDSSPVLGRFLDLSEEMFPSPAPEGAG
jgi:DNA-binding transcriptional LysR family regulator